MIKLSKNLKYYRKYFHGIQEVVALQSKEEVALGLLKTLSYTTLILPLIIGVNYLIIKSKIESLKNLHKKIRKAVKENEPIEQSDCIKFLIAQVEDSQPELFEKTFEQLTESSQKIFFSEVAKMDMFKKALNYVPKGITKIAFNLGIQSDYKKGCKIIKIFLDKLDEFKNLQELSVDLSGCFYLTRQVSSSMSFLMRMNNFFKEASFGVEKSSSKEFFDATGFGKLKSNNYEAAVKVLNGLIQHLKKYKNTLRHIDIRFKEYPKNYQEFRMEITNMKPPIVSLKKMDQNLETQGKK